MVMIIIIQLTPHRGFLVTNYMKYYAHTCITYLACTAKNDRLRWFAAHIVHSCQQYWTILLHPISGSTILLTTWQVWTTWVAKHCSILLNSGLSVFSRVDFDRLFSHESVMRMRIESTVSEVKGDYATEVPAYWIFIFQKTAFRAP